MSTFILSILTFLSVLFTRQNSNLDIKTQLPRHIILEHYTVKLDFSTIENDYYTGICSIDIRLGRPTKSIHFHTGRQQIKEESLTLIKIHPLEFYKPMSFVHKSNSVDVYFANELSEGNYKLQIDFITTLNDEEAELSTTTYADEDGERIAWLLGTNGAREIFPCWDEPVFKSIFQISIIHLTKHTVLSNMPVRETYRHDERLTWTHFHETPVIPPNLLAIVVSDFVYITNRINERISLRCRQQAALHLGYAKMVIEDVTLHFESQWKHYKELAKVDHVVIPAFPDKTMFKLGLIIYSEGDLVYDEKLDLVTRKIDVAQLVAYSIAHQYLDNLISSAFVFANTLMCLQNGIFELYATNAVNKIYPEFRIWDMFVVKTQQIFLFLDSLESSIIYPLVSEDNSTESNSIFFSYCHKKASIIFRMLKHALGDDVFWNGYEIFRKYSNLVNYDDLWTAMRIALDNSNSAYKFDIKNMMNPWTKLERYPVLKVEQHNNTHVKIYNMYPLNQEVQIPLTFTTQNKSNFIDTSPYLLTSSHTIYLPLNLSGWIIVNLQQAGYYRVNYDAIYWDRIINYLRTSDEYTKIHVLNRAQIIDDALYFLINGQLSLYTFLNLTKYLERETDYIAWFPVFIAFKHRLKLLAPWEIKTHMRDILHELLKNITYTDKPNEKPNDFIKCLRREAVKWGCLFGDPNCKKFTKITDEL